MKEDQIKQMIEKTVDEKINALIKEAKEGKGELFQSVKEIIMNNIAIELLLETERQSGQEMEFLTVELKFKDEKISSAQEVVFSQEY